MRIIAMRLNDNQELERYMHPLSDKNDQDAEYPVFPFAVHTLDFDSYLEDKTPWHWHKDFKIIEGLSGSVTAKSSRSSFILNPGDLCFINSCVFHQITPTEKNEHASIKIYQFLPELISGTPGSIFDIKYVTPIRERSDLDLVWLSAKEAAANGINNTLVYLNNLYEDNTYGREFEIRHQIDTIFMMLYKTVESRLGQKRMIPDVTESRMHMMVAYIRKNYAKPLMLNDIAASALISERECFRCFHDTLGISPAKYLQHYRIRMAARKLLETDDSIMSISEATGFSDVSYFGRVFKEQMHLTPSQFRKNRQYMSVE